MTPRRRFLTTTTAVGALVSAGLLAWSVAGPGKGDAIPARPQVGAIHATVDGPAAEPLPEIRVPELTPEVAPQPGRPGAEVRVPPRPRLTLAVSSVPEYREPLPVITPPDLRRSATSPSCTRQV